jgi:hypothetical protein
MHSSNEKKCDHVRVKAHDRLTRIESQTNNSGSGAAKTQHGPKKQQGVQPKKRGHAMTMRSSNEKKCANGHVKAHNRLMRTELRRRIMAPELLKHNSATRHHNGSSYKYIGHWRLMSPSRSADSDQVLLTTL